MPTIQYHRQEFTEVYGWFDATKRLPQTMSTGQAWSKAIMDLEEIARKADRANSSIRSLIELTDQEIQDLPDGDLEARIRLANRLVNPRSIEEARDLIKQHCGSVTVEQRVRDGLRSLLGTSSNINLIARRAMHDRSPRNLAGFQSRCDDLCRPATLKWACLGQLLVAIHLMRPTQEYLSAPRLRVASTSSPALDA